MKTRKTEDISLNEDHTLEDACATIDYFLSVVSDSQPFHSALGYRPLNECEQVS